MPMKDRGSLCRCLGWHQWQPLINNTPIQHDMSAQVYRQTIIYMQLGSPHKVENSDKNLCVFRIGITEMKSQPPHSLGDHYLDINSRCYHSLSIILMKRILVNQSHNDTLCLGIQSQYRHICDEEDLVDPTMTHSR